MQNEAQLSLIQQLCINTLKAGSVTAFIDLFRLTHMEQPLRQAQHTNIEDLISASSTAAVEISHQFSFDNPLTFNADRLQTVQALLREAESCFIGKHYFEQFESLSRVSDVFAETQRLRARFRMPPLVTPCPVVSNLADSLDTVNCIDILSLIDSPTFCRVNSVSDPLIAATAQIKEVDSLTQIYCPLDVYYAILARNTLYTMVQSAEHEYSAKGLLAKILPPLPHCAPVSQNTYKDSPTTHNVRSRMLLYTIVCYLRLGYQLHFFSLFRAAHLVLDTCLIALAEFERHTDISFSTLFEPTHENGYAIFLPDDIGPMKSGEEVGRENGSLIQGTRLASARLDLESVPGLPILSPDSKPLPTSFSSSPTETYEDQYQEMAELAYTARLLMVHNLLALAATALSSGFTEEGLAFLQEDVTALLSRIETLSKQGAVPLGETLTVSAIGDHEGTALLDNIPCTRTAALSGCTLLLTAADLAFTFNAYMLIIPVCRRLFELCTRLSIVPIAEEYAEQLLTLGDEFAIIGHAWLARWAAQRGDNAEVIRHLTERWRLANQELADNTSVLDEIKSASSSALPEILNRVDSRVSSASSDRRQRVCFADDGEVHNTELVIPDVIEPEAVIEDATLEGVVDQGRPISGTDSAASSLHSLCLSESEIRLYNTTHQALMSTELKSQEKGQGLLETQAPISERGLTDTQKGPQGRSCMARARALIGAREAVAAASALSCANKAAGNDSENLALMTDAWKTVAGVYAADAFTTDSPSGTPQQDSLKEILNEEKRCVSASVVEARVRLGAVKGQQLVTSTMSRITPCRVEVADDADLDAIG